LASNSHLTALHLLWSRLPSTALFLLLSLAIVSTQHPLPELLARFTSRDAPALFSIMTPTSGTQRAQCPSHSDKSHSCRREGKARQLDSALKVAFPAVVM
jgi:hypothetical protein